MYTCSNALCLLSGCPHHLQQRYDAEMSKVPKQLRKLTLSSAPFDYTSQVHCSAALEGMRCSRKSCWVAALHVSCLLLQAVGAWT